MVEKIKEQEIDTEELNWKEVWDKVGNQDDGKRCWFNCWKESPITPKEVADQIIQTLDIKPTDKVLEIGCGNGSIANEMAKHCNYYGVDYSLPMIKKLLDLKDKDVKLNLATMEADKILFADKTFDKVYSHSVFHYFPDLDYSKKVINHMLRVSKGPVFIGDLPSETFRVSHLKYNLEFFKEFNAKFIESSTELPRFGVILPNE